MIGVSCADCAYFAPPPYPIPRGRKVFGQCRRHAPLLEMSPDSKPRTIWPLTADDQWCGEHAILDTEG